MLSVVKLLQVNGEPLVKLDLPALRVGDPIVLRFALERTNGGRREALQVDQQRFRVVTVGFDGSTAPVRQVISLEPADGRPPTWKSLKKPKAASRRLSPAVSPRTPV